MADEIKLVALDMDGTLLTSDHEVSERTQAAIKKALANDIQVVLSTGRWLNSCYPYAEALGLSSFLITVNGGEIWTVTKELLERHLIDAKLMEKLYKLGQEIGMNSWMFSTDDAWLGSAAPEDFTKHEWLKIGFNSTDKDKLDKIVKELSFYEELELTNSLPTNVEVNPIGVNKANALRKVCDRIGISMNNVMAVGDSLNDIKMIQQAGVGVAMGNAQDAIKKVADFVTDTNNADGVAKAIERFVL
ncbi:Cof-type HAD-IIB family hydrolase [Virgibacillus oceani]|uniref:5-amino-6-(5-phospho-D-ribitylamino)uracil phosphatase YcsE n=1 Tax=Virgibacillus oceani TaxID=1479511 RepID=A0A917H4S6_9BACI|nr:Cof-type HAD-IIB family hydrolase [Virgibacillus oceani]GGG67575.1 5-amino-6-(5-phospho-D-ribitylamino)uracil phosphatase YcsE [Virgibacillus oceani]